MVQVSDTPAWYPELFHCYRNSLFDLSDGHVQAMQECVTFKSVFLLTVQWFSASTSNSVKLFLALMSIRHGMSVCR